MTKKSVDLRELKKQAHALKPVVRVGAKGLSESLHQEVDLALNSHELIKVKIVAERDERDGLASSIAEQAGAQRIASIGQIFVFYRKNDEE